VPYGAIGELCLGGSQLARGYLNRPEATESAFVMSNGERLYRTGDLARWVASGNIECLGRKDNQVKINGHRIEIGEIENAILSTGSVHDAAVLVVDFKGKSQIVVFCVVESGQEYDLEILSGMYRETLALLSISLPSLAPYMRPQIWIPLNKLPRLSSGKTDRKGLAQMTQTMGDGLQKYSLGSETTEMHPAVTSEQILLQTIWAELFSEEAKSISITSAFFSYGGDSISAINLVGRCRGHGYLLTVSDVLAHPVLQDMALRMRSIAQEQIEYNIPKLEASDGLRLQLAQAGIEGEDIQGIWPTAPGIEEFLIRGAEKEQFWQCQTVRRVPADFDFEHWQQLAMELTQRNDILRSMWMDIRGEWLQIVLKGSPIDVAVVECAGKQEVKDVVRRSWESRFEVGAGKPFIRYRLLVDQASGTRDLLIKIHHAMYDGTLLRM
jgi:aryl carrier-like protein